MAVTATKTEHERKVTMKELYQSGKGATATERAIEWIQSGTWQQDTETTDAIGVILSSLKERAEREKGCEYCTDLTRYKGFGYAEYFHQTEADEICEINIAIKYCPNCGRRLEDK